MKQSIRNLRNLVRSMRRPNITGKNIRSAIAMIVVFTTVYTLIMPAIALERNEASNMAGIDLAVQGSMHGNNQGTREYACSLDEHKHTDSCYAEIPVYDEDGNQTGTKRELICGKADWVVHTHDENCYIDGKLVCDLPEHAEHVHTDACYSTKKVLTCGMEEGEDHTHTDECYTEERVLTCGESALHTHTVDCYENGPDGESPVDMGWVTIETDEDGNQVINGDPSHLVCGQLELLAHQHTDACFVQAESVNVENPDEDEDNEEAKAGSAADKDAADKSTETEINTDADSINKEKSISAEPVTEAGDADHLKDVEIITEKDAETDADTQSEGVADVAEERTVAVEGSDYSIRVSYTEESGIPEDAEFRATALTEKRDDFDAYRERALAAVDQYTELENSRAKKMPGLFDLTIYDANGEKIQPKAPISVSVDLGKDIADDASGVYAVHFPGSSIDTVMSAVAKNPLKRAAQVVSEKITGSGAEVIETTEKNGEVQFEAESLSVYAIVYTVDFEYEVDGNVYQFSMAGGSSIALSDLIEIMYVNNSGMSNEQFMEQISDVTFSDPALVEVVKMENDWILNSLQPFDTNETLTVTMMDGQQFVVQVTDENSYSSNLSDFVSSVTINADREGEKYVIKPGKTYSAHFSFKEDPDGKQFSENGHLEYSFPDGFTPAATSGTFTIIATSRGVEYPVEGNTYRVENGKLIVDLNTSSPNYQYVESSPISTIDLNIEGVFDTNKSTITWSDTVSTDIKPDLDQGVSIEKSISSFDPATGVISYQLKVKSLNGTNTNIVVSDHMDGTAVAINQNVTLSGATMSSDGVTYTTLGWGDNTVNGFSFTIPQMTAGQEATVTYTATIDKAKMIANHVNLDYDGKNSVNAKPDEPGKPDSDAQNLKNVITAPTLTKGATVSDAVNGKRTITWTIEATSTDYFSLAGSSITDIIQEASRSDMKYSGDGLRIVVTNGNGSSETRTPSWSEVGVSDKNSAYSWTYNVPAEDTGNRTYIITYTTEVDVSDFAADTKLKNDVEDKYKKTTGTAEVGPDGENKKAELEKKVGEVSLQDIAWSVDITVPTQGLNKAVLTDDLPTQGNGNYHDTLQGSVDDIQISGLIDGQERAIKSYSNYQLVINFQKLVNGTWVDGLIGHDTPRKITVSFKTDNDQNWITAAETSAYLREHTNNAKFEANRQVLTDDATGTPMKTTFTKKAGDTGEVTVDGVKLPIYYYTINLTGVVGPFDITDSFDPRLIPAEVSLYSEQGKVYGGDQYHQGNAGSEPATIEITDNGAMTLHVTENSLAKNGTSYYSHYKIYYALRVKDAAALESLKTEAASTQGGKISLTNKAESPYGKDEAQVTFENNVLTKELLNDDALGESTNIGEFRITVNPDGYDLDPDSDMVTLTDTFSNTLSIDYNTIKVEPAEGATWYVSGNVATFTLPDETPLVITYKAKVIGNGDIHFDNTAEINGQKAIISETKYVTSNMGGTSGNYNIKILKHKRYDFTEVLGEVKFGLYIDSTGEPVLDKDNNPVTFITDENGKAYVEGSQSDNGWSLHPGTMYYLKELEAPEGYNLSTTQYKFQINANNVPDYDNNIYFNGDTLHINNTPKGGLEIKKFVYGTELDDAQKNAIVFTVTKPDGTTVSKKYSEFTNGKWKLTDLPAGTYTVTETCGEVDGYERTTSYAVDGDSTTAGQTATVEITDPSKETSVSFINRYKSTVVTEPETLQLKVLKKWYVGDEDKSLSDEFANETAEITLKRYKAVAPQTELKFYRTIDNNKQEIAGAVSVPAGATVSFTPSKGTNVRPMQQDANGMYNGTGYADAKYANPGNVVTFDFSEQESASVIEIWFDNDPGTVSVSYTGGATVSDNSFTKDRDYTGEKATITGGGSKTFNNLPLTEKIGEITYVYKYYVEETAKDGFTTRYQVGSGELKDTISAEDAIGTDGNATILVKNTKEAPQTGSLKITKSVTVPEGVDISKADGKYTFEIWKKLDSVEGESEVQVTKKADGTTDIGELKITVTNGVASPNEIVVDGLEVGTYVVKETEPSNSAMIIDTTADEYDANLGGIVVEVSADDINGVKTAAFINKYETTEATVKKVWTGTGTPPETLKVTLVADGESTSQEVTLSSGNEWSDTITGLPKYKKGVEIDYTWKEETLPDGCFLTDESKNGTITTLTNTFMEYDLKTSYVGTKIWSDDSNKYNTRPDNLTVTLYKNNVATNLTPTWVKDDVTDQWTYTFSDLPVFDDNGNVIQYRAEEGSVGGYTSTTETTATNYKIGQIHSDSKVIKNHPDNQLVWSFYSQTDLPFIIVKQGNNYLMWTQRVATPAELALIKQWAENNNFYSNHVSYVSGIGDVTIGNKGTINIGYVKTDGGYQVTITFHDPSQWSQFARGALAVTSEGDAYSSGTAKFTNTLETTNLSGSKTWVIDGTTVPDDPILTLTRTVTTTTGEGADAVTTTSVPETVTVKKGETNVNLQPTWSGSGKTRTFEYSGLPAKDKNGNTYTYSVAEYQFKVGDVTYTVSKNGDGTYVATPDAEHAATAAQFQVTQSGNDITNTKVTEFEFSKIWKDMSSQPVEWPAGKTITVKLNAYTNSETKEAVLDDQTLTFSPTSVPDGWSVVTSTDGKKTTFKTSGLAAVTASGETLTYYVVEIQVSGYKVPSYADEDGNGLINVGKASSGQQIINAPEDGVELPSTGGPGTRLFTILGSILFLGAGVLLWRKRKLV